MMGFQNYISLPTDSRKQVMDKEALQDLLPKAVECAEAAEQEARH